MAQEIRRDVARAKRIVVKVGSSTLTRAGTPRLRKFSDLAAQLAGLTDQGKQVVLVSSGAIAVGCRELGWDHSGRTVREKQAAAAVGQVGLVELYQRRFKRYDKRVAQVLLTQSGLEDRERFLNARHTLLQLLGLGVIPIVNENDTVATEEIRFGDNDNLSATIVNLIGADLLILLTDVDGLYEVKPVAGQPKPKLISEVREVTAEIRRAAQGSDSAFGRGGMITKLEAAQRAARSGATTVICNGNGRDILGRVASGEALGSVFLPGEKMASRKHWLAFTTRTRGQLVLDDGATRALVDKGRSLLPAGIVRVQGSFRIGDPVACVDSKGRERARGLVAYASEDVARICGLETREVKRVLGYSNGAEVIHRDDLVVLES